MGYSQCFNELIRQVALNLPERGLLLMRVRDEMKLTISAYNTLYESSVAFSTRKAIQAQDGIGDMEKKLGELEAECRALEEESVQLSQKLETTKRRENEKINVMKKKHTEAVEYLMRSNTQLEKAVKQMDPKNVTEGVWSRVYLTTVTIQQCQCQLQCTTRKRYAH